MTTVEGWERAVGPAAVGPARVHDGAFSSLNLLIDFGEAAERLRVQLRHLHSREEVFDAFLLAAALQQVLDDHLHRDLYSLGKVADHLPAVVGSPAARPAAAAAGALRSAGGALRGRRPSELGLIGWGRANARLVQDLAAAVVSGRGPGELAAESVSGVDVLPARLHRTVARLPHCFRSFDQRPEDVGRIVEALLARWAERTRPVLVVGLRTAGSYLAPLAAAFLGAGGCTDVEVLTLRPGQLWIADERRVVERARMRDALVVVVDEPPRSGAQLRRAARELERAGVPRSSLALLVPLFGSSAPAALRAYETVPLPWEEWDIHRRLVPEAVATDLSVLLPRSRVESVERVEASARHAAPRRGHVTALFRVGLLDERSAEERVEYVAAEGVGLGYLGRHALEVASRMGDYLPHVHGLRDGLLYRAWLPEEWRGTPSAAAPWAQRIAAYVARRNRVLRVAEDVTRRMAGRDTAADLVGGMLAEAFGRGSAALRPLLREAAHELLVTARPSVIDGSMTLDHWFAPSQGGAPPRKVDFQARAFSNEELASYDPVYDLACAAASAQTPAAQDALLGAYERLSGEVVAPERWLLYQLLHHRHAEQRKAGMNADGARLVAAERAMARAYQRYVAGHFLSNLAVPESGPLCAIDLDWVLEVRWLGFPAISPAGAMALLGLTRHGYRPVVATGRSLAEVRERCGYYRLSGGVAEYGAVVYSHLSGRTRTLLSPEGEAALAELRAVLRGLPGVHVDPAFEHSVRAYRIEHDARVGLDQATVEAVLARVRSSGRPRALAARSQTDFVAEGIDKGSGLKVLAEELGEDRIALAVGDTIHDLPMLVLAERAGVPSNADADVCRLASAGGARVDAAARPYGAGLLELVSRLLGHRPGRCAMCASPLVEDDSDRALLLSVLGALDGGAREKSRQVAVLGALLAKRERR